MKKLAIVLLLVTALAGIIDAGYLTIEHFSGSIPPCSVGGLFADCGKVLHSSYAFVLGVPLALIGFFHYSLEYIFLLLQRKFWARCGFLFLTMIGFLSSLYFVYLQLFVIHALCKYCMLSAFISTILFAVSWIFFVRERKRMLITLSGIGYRILVKPIFFLTEPEKIHEVMVDRGEFLGSFPPAKTVLSYAYASSDTRLMQTIAGITFERPVGLAAGFDYDAKLTQILGPLGFGFQTVGTITNQSYEGNPSPMLGRLPRSKSLMVNKGFKNLGAEATVQKLVHRSFPVPVGVSIGKTNDQKINSQKEAIADILLTFEQFEAAHLSHSFYELNISCPNLYGSVTFYPPKNLEALLRTVDTLKLSKPLFVKFPISQPDSEAKRMLDVIARHSPVGVIIGNLSKDRANPVLVPEEVARYSVGNFSGKATWTRSNELISLAFTHFGDRLTIIGCGGIFSAVDAYEKIRRGASLIQLITGMIYQGPQLPGDICLTLPQLLKRDGFTHISQAVGTKRYFSQ